VWTQLLAAGGILAVLGLMILALMRAARRGGQMEERAVAEARRAESEARAADSDRKAQERMADADARSVSDTAAAARERMRKRDPGTR
jgi:biopolymer transport protein ExbB/TolQ